MLLRGIFLLAAFVVLAQGAPLSFDVEENAEVMIDQHGQFLDPQGRQRFFRGVNVVFKGEPWVPITESFDPLLSLSKEDMDSLASWGFNAVRLGVMWPGAEPVEGVFNDTYLGIIKTVTDRMWERGIYTILDFHQDCLAASFCGEGIPEWAVEVKDSAWAFPEPFGKPFSKEKKPPVPSFADCSKHGWAVYQATAAASSAYQNLYNAGRVRDAFVKFWQRVAKDYIGHGGVLGYEIINEPWAGDVFADPLLMVPGIADERSLAPFYEVVAAGIRAVDPAHIVMFESVTWDDIRIGFKEVPMGQAWANRSALSYHYYKPPNLGIGYAFKERAREISRMKTGGFLTEFDLCNRDNMVEVLDTCDEHLCSWTGWEYKPFVSITGVCTPFFNASGALDQDRVRVVSRTYAPAVAGQVSSIKFVEATSVFTIDYTIDAAATAPTEIYINSALRYPKGAYVTLDPADAATVATSTNKVVITHAQGKHGIKLRVIVTPAL